MYIKTFVIKDSHEALTQIPKNVRFLALWRAAMCNAVDIRISTEY